MNSSTCWTVAPWTYHARMNSLKQPVSRRTVLTISSFAALTLAACSGQHTTSTPTPQPTTAPPTQSPTPSPSPATTPATPTSPAASTTAADPSTTSTSFTDNRPPSGPTSATGAPVNTQGRDLTLEDFFEPPTKLRQDLFNVATTSNTNGIGADLEGSQGVQAELRLENRFRKLTFKAGQANTSKSSDLILRVGTYKDGKNDQLIDIPFNEVKPVEVDVSNVNALRIDLLPLTQEGKSHYGPGSITGVMFDMRLE